MIHVCKNPRGGGGFHFLAHGLTTFKYFSLDDCDDIHVLHLVSDSQRLSFSQELTLTLTLGLSLRLEVGLA